MRLLVLFGREAKGILHAPASYALVALVWIVYGILWRGNFIPGAQGDVLLMILLASYHALGIQMVLVPIQTMRAIAEEKRSGTFEMLVTAPVRDHEVLLGKFFAIFAWNASIWLILPVCALIIRMSGGDPDFGPVLVSYLGVATTGALLISLGLLASAITRHVALAGLLGLVFCVALTLLPQLWTVIPENWPTLRSVLLHGDLWDQMEQAGRGILDLVHLAYKLAFTAFFLLLTTRVLEVRKWT